LLYFGKKLFYHYAILCIVANGDNNIVLVTHNSKLAGLISTLAI